jgi:hypothetical protein
MTQYDLDICLSLKASPHFTFRELFHSDTADRNGITNLPDEANFNIVQRNLQNLATMVLEPVRELLGGVPLKIDSGYRCKELNDSLPHSSKTSQHLIGQAADLLPQNMTTVEAFNLIKDSDIPFDQLKLEQGGRCLHISYRVNLRRDAGTIA